MREVILFNAVQNVVCNMQFDNKLDEEIFTNRLYNYVKNDELNYKRILTIVSKLKWIKSKEINDFFISYMKKNYSESMALIEKKEKAKSSSTRLISLISDEGLCNDFQIVQIKDVKEDRIKEFDKLLFIDDYIGSGETILSTIEDIWDNIKEKEIIIVAYACQERAIININRKYPKIRIDKKLIFNRYSDEFEKNDVYYIEEVCKCCKDERMQLGYNGAGAYVVLNKVAPNSDISMLWNPRIEYKGKHWMKLFDRQVSLEILSKKNNALIKNNSMLLMQKYNDLKRKYSLSFKEFEFLVYSFGCYYTKHQLLDDNYFDSENEYHEFTKDLFNKEYINEKNGYIIIINNLLYDDIRKVIENVYKESNNSKKNITYNF